MNQLVRFMAVGAAGYVVNLAVYTAAVHGADTDYRVAAVVAFCVALTTTFALNRRYTFRDHDGRLHHQAARYLLVSLVGFAVNLLALQVLVDLVGVAKVPAQAIAVVLAAPVNFAGQRFWTFAARSGRPAEAEGSAA
jgi:putative flippase GtrA